MIGPILLAAAVGLTCISASAAPTIDPARLFDHIKAPSSDAFEGRG